MIDWEAVKFLRLPWTIFFTGFLLFVGLLTLLFYSYINHSGATRWASLLEERRAAGRPFDWNLFVPAPVPDQDNFCMIPLMRSISGTPMDPPLVESGKSGPVEIDNAAGHFKQLPQAVGDVEVRSSYIKGTRADLAEYQKALAGSDYFPQSSPGTSPSQAVIKALSVYDQSLRQLAGALAKPEARFPLDYDAEVKVSMPLPQIGPLLDLTHLLCLHATAHLRAGQPEAAWTDFQIINKLHQALAKEPLLISHLVDITITGVSLNVIWEGLADRSWKEAQLRNISASLAARDCLKQYRNALEGDFAGGIVSTLDLLKKDPKYIAILLALDSGAPPPAGSSQRYTELYCRIFPRGCYDMAKVRALEYLDQIVLPSLDSVKHRVYAPLLFDPPSPVYSKFSPDPGNLVLRLMVPAMQSAANRFAITQADIDMARIACELELFHLQHGTYPESLSGLPATLPNDIIDGRPYRYRRTQGGRYEIWSIGWNEKDDGGVPTPDTRRSKPAVGDWVWRYPEN